MIMTDLFGAGEKLAFLETILLDDEMSDEEKDMAIRQHAETLGDVREAVLALAEAAMAAKAIGEARREEAARIKALADQATGAAERSKRIIMDLMTVAGIQKVEGVSCKVSIAANGGVLPLVILDESAIPEDFWINVPKIDNSRVRNAIEAGEPVPGAELGERGKSVRIK